MRAPSPTGRTPPSSTWCRRRREREARGRLRRSSRRSPQAVPAAMGQAEFPEALRGFMDRMGQAGLAPRPRRPRSGPPWRVPPVPLPDGARFEERTYANAAGSRAYKLYVPSGYTGQALPLVVMLHGCTPVARRLRGRHADERARGGADLPGRLSGADPGREHVEVLELVQRRATSSGIKASLR